MKGAMFCFVLACFNLAFWWQYDAVFNLFAAGFAFCGAVACFLLVVTEPARHD